MDVYMIARAGKLYHRSLKFYPYIASKPQTENLIMFFLLDLILYVPSTIFQSVVKPPWCRG